MQLTNHKLLGLEYIHTHKNRIHSQICCCFSPPLKLLNLRKVYINVMAFQKFLSNRVVLLNYYFSFTYIKSFKFFCLVLFSVGSRFGFKFLLLMPTSPV